MSPGIIKGRPAKIAYLTQGALSQMSADFKRQGTGSGER